MEARSFRQFASRLKFGPALALFPVLMGGGTALAALHKAPQVPAGSGSRPTLPGASDPHDSHDPHDPFSEQAAAKMTHLREDDRRKRLITDTAKLQSLITELKAEVDDTKRDELSLEVIRKATEIEKLAHDVRERMKN